jgi:large subunit ribosomal protein L1
MADDATRHDPLDQNANPEDLEQEIVEKGADADEAAAAEESAVNPDTAVAVEATAETFGVDVAAETGSEENVLVESSEAARVEEPTDKELVTDNEESNEAAMANDAGAVGEVDQATVAESDQGAEDTEAEEEGARKHKNRESTSEKAKKAAAERLKRGIAVSESGAPTKELDPLRKRGKNYRAKFALVLKDKEYSIEEALELVKQTAYAKFDAAVELHAHLKGEGVRGTVALPHGNGKTKKVAVADDETIEKIAAGKFDFDVLLATPSQMPKLARYAKQLGPKGLMPSPKAGTVTEDIDKTKAEIEGGRIEYRADKNRVVHLSIGRVSFPTEKLKENLECVEQVLLSHKILSLNLSATMGPGVKVALTR